ncbi:MAG: hypothetical protein H0T53_05730 [Herpetosiphonaceae bacterium]|nr:hypothetical protein [Herpetosiphonaceae bacterium]
MFDLAPHNPYSLPLRWPCVARAGLRGAGIERLAASEGVGAIVSDLLWSVAQPSAQWQETPAGVLWPAGGRSISQARRDLARWAELKRPVVVAIHAESAQQIRAMLAELDHEAHQALLLDMTAVVAANAAQELVAAARRDWRKPLLAEIALDGPPLPALIAALSAVDALVLGRGSRGVAGAAGLAEGRIVGPAAHPTLLAGTRTIASLTDKPLLAGAATRAEAQAVRQAGAAAVLLDVGLWHNPDLAAQLDL